MLNEIREKLIELIRYAPKVKLPFGGRANGKTYKTAGSIADHILADEEIKHAFELLKAEKEGRLIVPPCKVGDFVYMPWVWDEISGIAILEVTHIVIDCLHAYIKTDFHTDDEDYYNAYGCGRFAFDDFGKTVFLSREDAEKALRKEDESNDKQGR